MLPSGLLHISLDLACRLSIASSPTCYQCFELAAAARCCQPASARLARPLATDRTKAMNIITPAPAVASLPPGTRDEHVSLIAVQLTTDQSPAALIVDPDNHVDIGPDTVRVGAVGASELIRQAGRINLHHRLRDGEARLPSGFESCAGADRSRGSRSTGDRRFR